MTHMLETMRLLSHNAAVVLSMFLAAPHQQLYGYEIMQATAIKSGSLYPVLGRFEKLGWITGTMTPSTGGRPPRRVYTVNRDSIAAMRAALDRFVEAKGITEADRWAWQPSL